MEEMSEREMEEMNRRLYPNGKPPYEHLFQFRRPQKSEQMDEDMLDDGESTSTNAKSSFVIDASNISQTLKVQPSLPHPFPRRRSPRLNKFNNPYGLYKPGPRELRKYLRPSKGSITDQERAKAMERINSAPVITGIYDGFGFTAKEIADLESSRARPVTASNNPPKLTCKDIPQVVNKYIEDGFDREAAQYGVARHLNDPTKIKEFIHGFTALREMGFPIKQIGEALLMCDRNLDQSLAYIREKF